MSTTTPRSPDDLDLATSVAGEEDPGASAEGAAVRSAQRPMAPGDEAPPGTPGTGESTCPECGGSGRLEGRKCPNCEGTGIVTVGIGGA